MAVSPPRPKDLPMTALRAFEAAARLGSFAAAAAELGVTSGAVSAQIKALEAHLGARLFERGAQGISLTAIGSRAVPDFTKAFDALAAATQIMRAEAAPSVVHIATLPAIAQLWLSPRLPALRKAAPQIAISITAMEGPPNLKRAPFDLCLFYAESGMKLAEDEVFPVCAPQLAQRLRDPGDLAGVPCLIDSTWRGDWQIWAKAAGLEFMPRGPVFSLYALAVEEAAGGAGVLMARGGLVGAQLAAGRLVAPFAQRARLREGLRLWPARPMPPGSAIAKVAQYLQSVAGSGEGGL